MKSTKWRCRGYVFIGGKIAFFVEVAGQLAVNAWKWFNKCSGAITRCKLPAVKIVSDLI